jgi:thioredoxin reductase (NADPH)
MLLRGSDLGASMSRYLVDRIEGHTNIEVLTRAQVSGLEGREAVRWRLGTNGQEVRRPIRHLFLFIGAEPNTDWLAGSGVALDADGFVLATIAIRWKPTGGESSPSEMSARNP